MERERAQAVIEAVLFAMGDSVSISDLAIAVDESEKFVKEILEEMKVFYAESNRGIQIVELEDALTALTTDPVNLTFDRDFSTEVNLINPVPAELNISTGKVKVNVEIAKQETSIKSFADIPVRFLTNPARNTQQIASVICRAMPATVKVTLSGSTTDIARVTPQDIRVFADISEPQYSAPGQYRVQLAAQLTGIAAGGKVQVINLLPQTVQVTVEPGKVEPAVKK